jgi:hypothetical protein
MKVPIIVYELSVDGHPLARFAEEAKAVQYLNAMTQLARVSGGTFTGPLGVGTVRSIVEVDDPGEVAAQLDTAELIKAFDAAETAKADAPVEPVAPMAEPVEDTPA